MKTHAYATTTARLHRKTLCYSLVSRYAEVLSSLATLLPEISNAARTNLIPPWIKQRQSKSNEWKCQSWLQQKDHWLLEELVNHLSQKYD